MPNKQQHQWLDLSNSKIAIIGKFSHGGAKPRFLFSNAGNGDGVLKGLELFRLIRPHLRATADTHIQIGNAQFNAYSLSTPARAGGRGNEQPILADSPLFDDESFVSLANVHGAGGDAEAKRASAENDRTENIQKKGGHLFAQLLDSLDVVSRFSHGNFAKSLITIAREYLPLATKRKLAPGPYVDDGEWKSLVSTDHALAAQITRFLTCYPPDETLHLDSFRALLAELVKAKRIALDPRRISALSGAMENLKKALSMGVRSVDPDLEDLSRPANLPWLQNYGSDNDFYVPAPEVDDARTGASADRAGKASFAAAYGVFRAASDNLHRFVRTAPLHSYLFCWLASKYKAHGFKGREQAATQMFQVGIQKQGERMPGETLEGMERNRELIEKETIDPKLEALLKKDSRKYKNYKTFSRLAELDAIEILNPRGAFTDHRLRERLTDIFSLLSEISGGIAGELLKKNREANKTFLKFYGRILLAKPETGKAATLEFYAKELEKEAGDNVLEREFVKEFLKKVDPKARDLRRDIKEAFVRGYGRRSKNQFAQAFQVAAVEIDARDKRSRQLYGARLAMDVSGRSQGTATAAGGPAVTLTPLVLKRASESSDAGTKRQENLGMAMGAALADSTPRELIAPLSTTPTAATLTAPPEQPYSLTHNDKQVGTLTRDPDANVMKVQAEDPQTAAKLLSEETVVSTADGEPVKSSNGKQVTLVSLQLRGIEQFAPPTTIDGASPKDLAAGYDELGIIINDVVGRYASKDADDLTERLRRGLRALMLGEYLLAAPRDTVYLNADDLSKVLGVLVDMVEHVGDPREKGTLFKNAPSKRATQGLREINLSQYYPVPDEAPEEMEKVLQYHYTLCERLEDVRDYLSELSELRRFFDAVRGTNLEVVFINDTLASHNDLARPAGNLVVCREKPLVVYLTRQAFESQDGAAVELDALAARIAQAIPNNDLLVPIFVSPVQVSSSSTALPLIDPARFFAAGGLPRLKQGMPGYTEAKNDETVVTKLVQAEPYLCLAASLLSPAVELGAIAAEASDDDRVASEGANNATVGAREVVWEFNDALKDIKWPKALNVQPAYGSSIAQLLNRAWYNYRRELDRDVSNALFENLVFCKLLNLAIFQRRDSPDGYALSNRFGQLLARGLADAEAVKAAASHLDASVARSLRPASVSVKLAGAWVPVPTDNPAIGLTAEFRVERADGAYVDFNNVGWKNKLEAILPPGA